MITGIDMVRTVLRWAEALRKTKDWKNEDEEILLKVKYRLQSWDGLIRAGEEFKTVLEAVLFFEDNDETTLNPVDRKKIYWKDIAPEDVMRIEQENENG